MIDNFLEPSFADSPFENAAPSDGSEWLGPGVGGLISLAGIAVAYYAYVRRRGVTLELRDRFAHVHAFLFNKWYFDELFDGALRAAGRHLRHVRPGRDRDALRPGLHRRRRDRRVRVGTSFARSIQTGYLRAYALLLLLGVAALALYFLLVSS